MKKIEKELNLFLNTKRALNTRKSYERHLLELFNFKNIETIYDFKNLKIDDYYEWKNFMLEKGISENSIRPKLSAVSKFYEFLMRRPEYDVRKNIMLDSDLYENTKKIVNPEHTTWLTEEETKVFLSKCHNPRELAICAVFLNTGIRVSELINLELKKLNIFRNENGEVCSTIIAIKKGGKIQELFFNHFVTNCIQRYLQTRKSTDCKNLFVSNGGKPMSVQSIDRTIKKIKNKAGITKNISAHSLRRSTATNMYNHGYKIEDIQSVLSHSDAGTTQIYLKGLQNRARNVFESYTMSI